MSGPVNTVSAPTRMLVVNTYGKDAAFYDLETFTETKRFELPPTPHEIRHDTKRGLAYVTLPYKDGFYDIHEAKASDLAVIDLEREEVVEVIDLSPEVGPHGMHLDASTDLLWMSVETDGGGVVALDLESREIVARIATGDGDGKPHWITGSADGSTIYTANKESRFVSVIDVVAGELKAQIPMPGGSEDVELNQDGSRLFVSSRELPVVHVVDTATDEVCGEVKVEELPGRLQMTSDGKLVVTHFNVKVVEGESIRFLQGRVSIVDPEELTVKQSIAVGKAPCDLITSPDGSVAYVTNAQSGTLFEVDLEDLDIKRGLTVGWLPHGVILL